MFTDGGTFSYTLLISAVVTWSIVEMCYIEFIEVLNTFRIDYAQRPHFFAPLAAAILSRPNRPILGSEFL